MEIRLAPAAARSATLISEPTFALNPDLSRFGGSALFWPLGRRLGSILAVG
jgi:hypothetical protein